MIRNYGLLDPTVDFMFKQIFGDTKNKTSLISLLNAILDGNPKIEDVTIQNTELDKNYPDEKSCRLDVYAVTKDGVYLDIEIQRRDTGEIPDRSVYYLSKLITASTSAGNKYNPSNAISIWIMKENLRKGEISVRKSAREEIVLCAKPTFYNNEFVPYSNKGRIILIFLDKFANDENLNSELKKWIQFFNTPAAVETDGDEGILLARKKLDYASADTDTRLKLDAMSDEEVMKNSIEYVTKRDSIVPVAKRMIADSINLESIARYFQMNLPDLIKMMNDYNEHWNI